MTLSVAAEKRLGDFTLAVSFESDARVTALFGRSGSGKSSLGGLVAGLTRPDRGRIAVDGTTFADTSRRLFVPAHRRRVACVFQDARLFPHLSVASNLRYGQWFAPRDTRDPNAFDRVVDVLGIAPLLRRRPAALSGGERQRVAIGRALLSRPRLLVMDEPLAALDEARKAEILPHIERLRDEAGLPILYITHSVAEVLRLAGAIVVLDAGRVAAIGAPAEVLARLDLLPAGAETESGAMLDAVVEGEDAPYALTVLRLGPARLLVPRIAAPIGTPVRLRVRARDVILSLNAPEGISALNALPARVLGAAPDGPAGLEVRLDCGETRVLLARVTRKSFEAMGLASGVAVFAVLKAVSFERRFALGGGGRVEL